MPKDAINLDVLLNRFMSGEIKMDTPLIEFKSIENDIFPVFQDSGLNVLLGSEGNGKTKFLTHCICMFLESIKADVSNFGKMKILYVDTERPESQYAYSINHIFEKTKLTPYEFFGSLDFLSVMDISHSEMINALESHLLKFPNQKYIIVIDHILNMVQDMNSTMESTQIDQFLKKLISNGHILIASIHKPNTGFLKGLGHLGATIQRLASFVIDISNNESGDGFDIKHIKSRISGKNKAILSLTKDQYGNIDNILWPKISNSSSLNKNVFNRKYILAEFISKGCTSKSEFLELIRIYNDWSPNSSSSNTFFKTHFADLILFKKTGFNLTEAGGNLLRNE